MAWGSIKNYRREPLPCAGALEAERQKAGAATKDTVFYCRLSHKSPCFLFSSSIRI